MVCVMEIITGIERRRRWRVDDKLRIVAETQEPGARIADVARRHEISRGLLWNWRHQARRGTLRQPDSPAFMPVCVTGIPGAAEPRQAVVNQRPSTGHSSIKSGLEVTLPDGTSIRIEGDVSLAMLRRIMMVLRG